MSFNTSSADLSSGLLIRKQLAAIRQHVALSGDRLATGQKSDPDLARDGQLSNVYSLDKEIRNLERYNSAVNDGRTRFDAIQLSLQNIRESAYEVTLGVLGSIGGPSITPVLIQAETAEGVLRSVVSTLNQSVAGQSLFSGAALSGSALVNAEVIVADVASILSGAPDVATGLASVDFYFDDPTGGFASAAYVGSTTDAPTLEVSDGLVVSQDVRADNLAIKETIQNLALISAVSRGAVTSDSDKATVLQAASNRGLQTNEQIVLLEQKIGLSQSSLESASTKLSLQTNALESARNRATAVDLFEEASVFEELQVQLETSYKVLVRLSSLSLSNFLR